MKRFPKSIILSLMALVFAVVAVSCGGGRPTERIITVSIQPQRYLLEQIVGDRFKVMCLLSAGSNPESYEPSVTHLMNLEKSEAYFCIGNIGFELAIVEKAKAENPDLKVCDNSMGVELIYGSHGLEHDHAGHHNHEVDPHIWTSVANATVIAKNMLDAVVELDSKHADYYNKRFAELKQKLDNLDKELHAQLDSISCRSFIVWHPSLSYFARDYGLQQISMEYEGKEAPIGKLKSEIDAAKKSGAKIFFYQKEFDSRQISTVSSEIGSKMVTINPMNYEWDVEMKNIANALASE